MSSCDNKYLIFLLGEISFLLELNSVIEVVEHVENDLDPSRSDVSRGIVTALYFRQTWIPVVDPALKLGLVSVSKLKDRIAIVLKGAEGNWAVLVDRVMDVTTEINLIPCEIPFLLKVSALDCYSEMMLLEGVPQIVFEPERYYGSHTVAV